MVRVLFVCLGNICRSPTAEGVFRKLVAKAGLSEAISIDSAGTSGWHIGEPPDGRGQDAAALRGYDLSSLRGRQVADGDFDHFDYIIGMDQSNIASLSAMAPTGTGNKISLLLEFAPQLERREVPDPYYGDPYYGGPGGFDDVLDMIEAAARGLLDDIRARCLK